MTQFRGLFANCSPICALNSSQLQRKEENVKGDGKVQENTSPPVQLSSPIQTRSLKKVSHQNFQISFQSGILDSHVSAFEEFLQKFYGIEGKQVITIGFKSAEKITQEHKNQNYADWMQAQLNMISSIKQETRIQLIEDWKMQQNLCKFLKLTTDPLQPSIRAEIIHLASLVWEQYLNVVNLRWGDEEKIKKISEYLAQQIQNICQSNECNFLGMESNSKSCQEAYLDFLLSFAKTIYLVIEEYFEDTICCLDNLTSRRLSSVEWGQLYEEDLQLVRLPKKMPKLM